MKKTKKLVLCALLAAFVYVATIISIGPLPPTNGYVHLGDALVILAGFILGPVYGGFAAGLGSLLADVSLGYATFAPATFVIKFLVACAAGIIYNINNKGAIRPILASVTGELIMVVGYYIFEAFILGGGIGAWAALGGVPANLFQAVAGIIIAMPVTATFKSNKSIKKFLEIKEQYKK